MIRSFIAPLLLLLTLNNGVCSSKVPLAPVSFQFESLSDSDASNFLNAIRQETEDHLNDYFEEYFLDILNGEFFSHVSLSLAGYEKYEKFEPTGEIYNYVARVEFTGDADFNDVPVPHEDFLNDVLVKAFLGDNRIAFWDELKESMNPLLEDITYMNVRVDEDVISEEDLQDSNEPTENIPVFYFAIAGAGGVLVAFIAVYFCYCRSSRRSSDKAADKNGNIQAEKQRGRPEKTRKLLTSGAQVEQPDLELASTRSPSPIRSLGSQDSSKFTYNPKSRESDNESHSFTKQVDVNARSIDVSAWQKSALVSPITPTFQPSFGQDISAIEVSGSPDKSRLNVASFQDQDSTEQDILDVKDSKSSKAHAPKEKVKQLSGQPSSRYGFGQRSLEDSTSAEYNDSLVSDGSDVIKDLKNLSVQIRAHRTLSTSRVGK
mmetsp:Transcript_14733/g.23035  ORF Transcript_14733/g.23035 Transcript_14733/m.23035 type:complete len:432 (-) Transcript_14733:269-1564(-)